MAELVNFGSDFNVRTTKNGEFYEKKFATRDLIETNEIDGPSALRKS